MITLLKLASVSAFLSAGVVGALDPTHNPVPASGKIYHDRLIAEPVQKTVLADASSGPVLTGASASGLDCRAQAWPNIAPSCISGGERRPVRSITIERRDAPNTSTLVRVPAGAFASH